MRGRRFHLLAWTDSHTDALAPVSASGEARLLLTTTGARKSQFVLDFQVGSTLFLGVSTRCMLMSYSPCVEASAMSG